MICSAGNNQGVVGVIIDQVVYNINRSPGDTDSRRVTVDQIGRYNGISIASQCYARSDVGIYTVSFNGSYACNAEIVAIDSVIPGISAAKTYADCITSGMVVNSVINNVDVRSIYSSLGISVDPVTPESDIIVSGCRYVQSNRIRKLGKFK